MGPRQGDRKTLQQLQNDVDSYMPSDGASISLYPRYGGSEDVEDAALSAVLAAHEKNPKGRIVIYGYSYGEVLAQQLAQQLDERGITVEILITVDAANLSGDVNRSIPKNVKCNVNFYQRNKASGFVKRTLNSRGKPNSAEKSETKIENSDVTNETFEGEPVDHYNIDNATIW